MKQRNIRRTLLALVLSAFGASTMAQVVQEQETNDSIATAQKVAIGAPGSSITIKGVIGNMSGAPVLDVDFYTFWGNKGDHVGFDIDNGIKSSTTPGRSVDTILTLFGPGPVYPWKWKNDDAPSIDTGSISRFDPKFTFTLDATGWWVIAVTPFKVNFTTAAGGALATPAVIDTSFRNGTGNGDYTLIISGLTPPPIKQIHIEIKPGSGDFAPVNPKSKGTIPVALLSSSDFNALNVNKDPKQLKFGRTGQEMSLRRCGNEGEDVNGDGLPDLVCHFENEAAHFTEDDDFGIVTGQLSDGTQFEGKGHLKVVPVKRSGD